MVGIGAGDSLGVCVDESRCCFRSGSKWVDGGVIGFDADFGNGSVCWFDCLGISGGHSDSRDDIDLSAKVDWCRFDSGVYGWLDADDDG